LPAYEERVVSGRFRSFCLTSWKISIVVTPLESQKTHAITFPEAGIAVFFLDQQNSTTLVLIFVHEVVKSLQILLCSLE
jgi:hypothetical protein